MMGEMTGAEIAESAWADFGKFETEFQGAVEAHEDIDDFAFGFMPAVYAFVVGRERAAANAALEEAAKWIECKWLGQSPDDVAEQIRAMKGE